MENLIIDLHWVSQLEIFFHLTNAITISYKSFAHFRVKFLENFKAPKTGDDEIFAFDRCGECSRDSPFEITHGQRTVKSAHAP